MFILKPVSHLLLVLNSSLNFLIYCFVGARFFINLQFPTNIPLYTAKLLAVLWENITLLDFGFSGSVFSFDEPSAHVAQAGSLQIFLTPGFSSNAYCCQHSKIGHRSALK